MKAVYIKEFGGPENLEIREVPGPSKAEGTDVIVQVKAAGLNRADLIQRRGLYPPPPGYSPNIPGLEFAGEIVEVGSDVRDFKIGDRVFGITGGDAQAEFLKIDHCLLAKIPNNLSYAEGGAIPEAFVTAYDAVFSQAGLKGDETLLIHAVGSGVGLAALQLAKAFGHRVFGTSRAKDKLDRCAEFALDEAIVVAQPPRFGEEVVAKTDGRGVDVILDLVGAAYFDQNLHAVAKTGRLMLVGLTGGSQVDFNLGIALSKRLTLIGTVLRARSTEEKSAAMGRFARDVVPLLAEGTVRPNVDRVFNFEDIRSAHEYLESNESFGKVVLEF
jgi:putative PIG3 family NAD(P)H quinone oxidoreductase